MRDKWWILGYSITLLFFSWWTYTQVEPNLVLSSRPVLWQWQQKMWQLGFEQRHLSTWLYTLNLFVMMGMYVGFIFTLHINKTKFLTTCFAITCLILSVSYPALSHDVFNYAMNAKMVWKYQANPHTQVAINFPNDPWLPYMHNIHTPAPYAYGWTFLSLIPGIIAGEHIKLNLWLFRLFILGFFILLLKAQLRLLPKHNERWFWAFAFNPLVLIETVSSTHNDVVMMALALWSLILAQKARNKSRWYWLPAGLLFLFSISIKYVSVLLLAGIVLMKLWPKLKQRLSFGGLQSLILFAPLLTTRSQRFLPWYLIWSLSFVPLSTATIINVLLILFSFTGLLSYIPYLLTGTYTPQLLWIRSVILFVPPICFAISYWFWRLPKRTR